MLLLGGNWKTLIIKLVNKMIDLKIKWQHCWYIFQWGENEKKGKSQHAGVHRGVPGDRVCP